MTTAYNEHNPVGTLRARLTRAFNHERSQSSTSLENPPAQPIKLLPVTVKAWCLPLSRAAHLHIINQLSRHTAPAYLLLLIGSLMIAGCCFALSALNSLLWLTLVSITLMVGIRRNHAFRAGDHARAGFPLRWRADHIANTAVTGIAIASGVFLLPLEALFKTESLIASSLPSVMVAALYLGTVIIAAWLQRWHARASAALMIPFITALGVKIGALQASGLTVTPYAIALALSVGCVPIMLASNISIIHQTIAQYPRTISRKNEEPVSRFRPRKVQRNIAAPPLQRKAV